MSIYHEGPMTDLMRTRAKNQTLSLSEAVELMKENSFLRPVRETLARACGMENSSKDELEEHLVKNILIHYPVFSEESVRANVRLWLADDKYSIKRVWALRLALMFGFDLDDTVEFLARACQESFHWRDPQDIAYIFAVLQNMSPAEATAMLETLEADPDQPLAVPQKELELTGKTELIADEIWSLSSFGELKEYLKNNKDKLGAYHNTGYKHFMDFLLTMGWKKRTQKEEELEEKRRQGKRGSDGEETVTTRDILENCLFRSIVSKLDGENGKAVPSGILSGIQKELRKGIPDETVMSKMINRKKDINRKLLILMFLATDGVSNPNPNVADQLEETQPYSDMIAAMAVKDIIEERYEDMKSMLIQSGYNALDPRIRFDWICLYCMGVEEAYLMDGRMQRFLSELFEKDVDEPLAGYRDEDAEEDVFQKIWEEKFND